MRCPGGAKAVGVTSEDEWGINLVRMVMVVDHIPLSYRGVVQSNDSNLLSEEDKPIRDPPFYRINSLRTVFPPSHLTGLRPLSEAVSKIPISGELEATDSFEVHEGLKSGGRLKSLVRTLSDRVARRGDFARAGARLRRAFSQSQGRRPPRVEPVHCERIEIALQLEADRAKPESNRTWLRWWGADVSPRLGEERVSARSKRGDGSSEFGVGQSEVKARAASPACSEFGAAESVEADDGGFGQRSALAPVAVSGEKLRRHDIDVLCSWVCERGSDGAIRRVKVGGEEVVDEGSVVSSAEVLPGEVRKALSMTRFFAVNREARKVRSKLLGRAGEFEEPFVKALVGNAGFRFTGILSPYKAVLTALQCTMAEDVFEALFHAYRNDKEVRAIFNLIYGDPTLPIYPDRRKPQNHFKVDYLTQLQIPTIKELISFASTFTDKRIIVISPNARGCLEVNGIYGDLSADMPVGIILQKSCRRDSPSIVFFPRGGRASVRFGDLWRGNLCNSLNSSWADIWQAASQISNYKTRHTILQAIHAGTKPKRSQSHRQSRHPSHQ